MHSKTAFRWAVLGLMPVVLFMLNLSLGSVHIPVSEIFKILTGGDSSQPVWNEIVWDFRMTKAITCMLAGSALALGGLQMQTLFRNPLAGPDVLGLSSGASLAVSLVFMSNAAGLTIFRIQSPWTVAIAASLGCSLVFLIMLAISRRLRDNVSLLIIGLMIGAGTASIVSVLQYLSKAEELQVYILWTFGSLGGLNWIEIEILTIVLAAGTILGLINTKSLNAWLLGDNYAQSLGVNIQKSRILAILSASALTGGVTAFCGPIAFVGLAVPHLVKLMIRSHNHKMLIPAVLIGGASLVLLCDIIAQLPGSTKVLPINAITALIGAPVVIWVILRIKVVRS
jgi:iron complex transport system permease protein